MIRPIGASARYFLFRTSGRMLSVVHLSGTVLRVFLELPATRSVSARKKLALLYPGIKKQVLPGLVSGLASYFAGRTGKIAARCDLSILTRFQRAVLKETSGIGKGRTRSYAEIAKRIGGKGLSRAVGSALAANPVPVIIPCHRVIRSDGSPGGFMSDPSDRTGWKRYLLDLESRGAAGNGTRRPRRRS